MADGVVADHRLSRFGLASLTPATPLELLLAERVAFALWRLARLGHYERECVVADRERVEQELPDRRIGELFIGDSLATLRQALAAAEHERDLFQRFPTLPEDAALDGADAYALLARLAETAGLSPDELEWPGLPEDEAPECFAGWTVALVRRAIVEPARRGGIEPQELLERTTGGAAIAVELRRDELARATAAVERARGQRILPAPPVIDRVIRYEAHLSRELYRALHELEALQARRRGEGAPLLRVDVDGPGVA